jgi:hypothetical protein
MELSEEINPTIRPTHIHPLLMDLLSVDLLWKFLTLTHIILDRLDQSSTNIVCLLVNAHPINISNTTQVMAQGSPARLTGIDTEVNVPALNNNNAMSL